MEMHQLKYFVAVAHTGNFSRAAEQCHVSQPSLSQQIQKLESELGERLFYRMKRVAKLTPHGEKLMQHALRILEEVDAAEREAKDAKVLLSGTVILGVLPTIAPYLLPGVMLEFMKQYPGVEVIVQEETTHQLLKLLFACEIDLAIASHPIDDSRLEIRELFTEELMVALPPDHRLGRKQRLSISDLERERFIVMKEEHCLGDQVLNFCNQSALRPNISFRSAQLETIQALVRSGLGISLIPKMAVRGERKNQPVYRAMRNPKPDREIIALWPRHRSPGRATEQFLNIILKKFSSGRT